MHHALHLVELFLIGLKLVGSYSCLFDLYNVALVIADLTLELHQVAALHTHALRGLLDLVHSGLDLLAQVFVSTIHIKFNLFSL